MAQDGGTDGSGRGLVVALDGPASSGKSSVGAAAAARLGYRFCDTGLLYRAITWLALERGVDPEATDRLVALVDEVELIDAGDGRLATVAIGGSDRTEDVRGPDVDVAVSGYARVAELRRALLQRQRALAAAGRIIMAGRDIGTVVLPDADLKLYLDASAEERAKRRVAERELDAGSVEAAEVLADLRRRDGVDSTRDVAPLRPAADAAIVRTDGNAFDTTVDLVVAAIRSAEQAAGEADPERADAREARRTRERRPPPKPTPIATRMTPFLRVGGVIFRFIVRALFRLRIEGDLSRLPREGPLIVAANHASSADPILIGAFLNQALGRPLNWLGKRELVEFWLTGWAFRWGGIHPVDRDAADLDSFRTAMRILEAGQMLAVFPEGTRSRDGALQPVREGVGMLALRSGAAVLPVAVIDSDLAWPRGRLLPRFGRHVTVRYGEPFHPSAVAVGDAAAAPAGATTAPRARGRRGSTGAATRQVMARIAALLPPRQRGVYAGDARNDEAAGASDAADPGS